LKDLKTNHLVKWTVYDSFSPTVVYEITEHIETLFGGMKALHDWGQNHRKKIIGK
jgi:DNA-binding HxlR family transcriptional regulator